VRNVYLGRSRVVRFFLVLAGFAAAIGMAAPAHADSNDDAFIASLQAAGMTFPDAGRVIKLGRSVCQAAGKGTPLIDVVKKVQSQNSGLHGDNAARFTAIAAEVYCPQALATGSPTQP
jgi:Protein of unknown function (DUF732)